MIWNIIIYLAVGALAGWIAGNFMKSTKKGFWNNALLGIVGSFVGCWVGSLLGIGGSPLSAGFHFGSIVTAVLGACLLIAVVRLFKKKA